MRGRKPNPTQVETTSVNRAESVDAISFVPEPCWAILTAPDYAEGVAQLAREKWAELLPEMEALGTVGPENAAALEMLCVQYARWKLAEAQIAKLGPVIRAPKTGVPMHNPFLSVANAAADRFIKLAAELGLTPAMRGRVGKRPMKTVASGGPKPKLL